MRIRLAAPTALALVVCALALFVAGIGAAAGTTARRCKPEGYGLEQQALSRRNLHQDAVKLTAGWLTAAEGRRSCSLQTTIRLTVSDSGGVEAQAQWSVSTVLHPWSAVVHTWVWRNWCQGEATIEYHLPNGTHVGQRVVDPPTCTDASAPTALVDLGTGPKYVKRGGARIPPHILPPGTPPPLHFDLVNPTNGWIVSDGYSLVAVYAGSAKNKASLGQLAIVRQNPIFGVEYYPPDLLSFPKAGALKITRAPHGRAHETSAQRGKLTFISARGTKGVLHLSGDHVRITASK